MNPPDGLLAPPCPTSWWAKQRHFVVYHSREKMGEDSKPFQLYTNKTVDNGSLIWTIEGTGKRPTHFTLNCVFIVTTVEEPSPHPDFHWAAYGSKERGHHFQPHIPLNELEWFPAFRSHMGNFGFGLHPLLEEKYINELVRIAEREGVMLT